MATQVRKGINEEEPELSDEELPEATLLYNDRSTDVMKRNWVVSLTNEKNKNCHLQNR